MQEMEEPTIDERRRWWSFCYSITAMNKAKAACDRIAEHCEDWDHPLFEPLALAVHTFYSRPFLNSYGAGRLEATIVPEVQKGIHEWLTHFRSSFMAHTDATEDRWAGRVINEVVYYCAGEKMGFTTLYGRSPLSQYVDAGIHCSKMVEVFQAKLTEFYRDYGHLMPLEQGEYLLSLEPDSPTFRLGHITPDRDTFIYK
ncbi:hypothetical protein [Luteolibacter sp. AS25]|uniref:hypothetical protein n=1 Tax=Luteolibacter sp. AS25 TaxID=3135776 RepID=UPI00398B94A6